MTPNDFSLIAGVGTVPMVDDWRTLTWNEFLLKAHSPMIFKGLGAGTRAGLWNRAFFRAFGDELCRCADRWGRVAARALGRRSRSAISLTHWTPPKRACTRRNGIAGELRRRHRILPDDDWDDTCVPVADADGDPCRARLLQTARCEAMAG